MNKTVDLQIFLCRTSGDVLSGLESHARVLLVDREIRNQMPPAVSNARLANREETTQYPQYIAVANSESVETVTFPFSQEELDSFIRRFGYSETSLRECIEFGTLLFDAVFRRSIRDQLRALQASGSQLRLTIATSTPELIAMPWELLCDSSFGALPVFLSQRKELLLSRSLRLFNRAKMRSSSIAEGHLRLLLVTAAPTSLSPIDSYREEEVIRFAFENQPHAKDVEFSVLHGATVNELRKALGDHRPHVVHFACHGTYHQREGMGSLAFCKDNSCEEYELVNGFRIATLLRESGSVKLVFVNSCYGAFQNDASPYSGVAECIHANGVSAVVSLQFAVLETTAQVITLSFYHHLLCDRFCVEECVTRVRQYLFLNNHRFCESFGLLFFRDNLSLRFGAEKEVRPRAAAKDVDLWSKFEEGVREKALQKLSTELNRIDEMFASLTMLAPPDLALLVNIFGAGEIGPRVLGSILSLGIQPANFLKLAKLASVLCHATFEQRHIETGFLLREVLDANKYLVEHAEQIAELLEPGFFMGETRRIVAEAIRVDGIGRVFTVLVEPGSKEWVGEHIGHVKEAEPQAAGSDILLGNPRWRDLMAITVNGANCAFILPGRSWIKVIAGGSQMAEFRNGKWGYATLAELRDRLPDFAAKTGIEFRVLVDIIQKALVASDSNSGRTFVIRQSEGASPRLGNHKQIAPDGGELSMKLSVDFGASEYLTLTGGDGAVILSCEGKTLATNATLAPRPATKITAIPGTGSRHHSAQKITAECAVVAVVVSEDGPLTIFFRGEVFYRS